MKLKILFFASLLGICVVATAQVELASKNYFPADAEFRELQKIVSEESFDDPTRLSKIENGALVQDVGFDKYERKNYSLADRKEITIEIFTLKDSRAAYSLLTLLRDAPIQAGLPGEAHTIVANGLGFYQGRYWIQLKGRDVQIDLLQRIARSVSNRIGPVGPNAPGLISQLPEKGYDAASLRYFPSLAAFKKFAGEAAATSLSLVSDVEIAQAQYSIGKNSASLVLLNFPTGQVAEDYFATIGIGTTGKENLPFYAKKVGPIVAVLSGPIDPASADDLLRSIRYSYSIRWIFEKKNQTKIIWGVPVQILGTVVRSLFFIAVLALVSVAAGAGFAFLRFSLRKRFSKNETDGGDEADIIRLRLR
jgi:hypothetical protein